MVEDAQPLDEIVAEYLRCQDDPAHFLRTYALIEMVDEDGGAQWEPFDLWPAQAEVLKEWEDNPLLVVLKARQLGITWLMLGALLHLLVFSPGASVGLFSRRETEAVELMRRLKGMHARLPSWLRARAALVDTGTEWRLSSGSSVLAFPTSAGDGYTFSAVLVDEADLCPDLGRLLSSVKPTIDAGGRLVLVSKVNKRVANSPFKRIFRQAEQGKGPWRPVFLPWSARPDRDAAWHDAQREHSLAQDSSLDFLHENYPATSAEALAPNSRNKRLPSDGLLAVYEESTPLPTSALPPALAAIAGLRVYRLPVAGRRYKVGADPAEGLPGADHDDSALCVVDDETGEEVCAGLGRWEPKHEFGDVIEAVARAYNGAAVLVERNNHGHAVLGSLDGRVDLLAGADKRPGYPKSPASKAQLWDGVWGEITSRRQAREAGAGAPLIRDATTFAQLASLEARTCKAPPGEHDDGADAFGLASHARTLAPPALLMGWA